MLALALAGVLGEAVIDIDGGGGGAGMDGEPLGDSEAEVFTMIPSSACFLSPTEDPDAVGGVVCPFAFWLALADVSCAAASLCDGVP